MMKFFAATALTLVAAAATHAQANELSASAQKSLMDAYQTNNQFVIQAVVARLKQEFGTTDAAIADTIKEQHAKQEREAQAVASIAPAAGDTAAITGELEAGAILQNGNSKNQDVRIAGKVNYEPTGEVWANTTTFSAENSSSDNVRSNEEYRLDNQTRWKLSDTEYAFVELGYVSDRFSGFDSRLSETVGYGRELYKNDAFVWTGEAGVGARQTELTNGDNEDSLLGTLETTGAWQINDGLKFTQTFKSAFEAENVISESDSKLRSDLTDKLYLSLGINVEHISDAPAGSSQTDTRTSASVGYKF